MAKNSFKDSTPENHSKQPAVSSKKSSWKSFFSFSHDQSLKSIIFSKLKKYTLYFFLITIGWATVLKYLPIWFTPTMISRKIDAINNGKPSKLYKDWEPIENISPEVSLAVLASEDQLFPDHKGYDFGAMSVAFKNNLKGKKIKGVSTISQQVAKNVFLWQGRSYIRKVLEVYFTFLIEIIWGKERILEVYLNVAEMGEMTFGVEAASLKYYDHSAKKMSRVEAARIAAVLPSPLRFSIKNPSNYIIRRTNTISKQMRRMGGQSFLKKITSDK